ncbi:MAG: putative transrane protein [Segetibacter sp.]|nr:putative transrane protein [Segetibacter sp.]
MESFDDTTTNRPTNQFDLMKIVLLDTNLNNQQKIDLIDELRKNNPASTDRWSYRYAIWILGAAIGLTIVAMGIIGWHGKDVPDGLIAIGSAVAGGIAGLLSQSRESNNENKS